MVSNSADGRTLNSEEYQVSQEVREITPYDYRKANFNKTSVGRVDQPVPVSEIELQLNLLDDDLASLGRLQVEFSSRVSGVIAKKPETDKDDGEIQKGDYADSDLGRRISDIRRTVRHQIEEVESSIDRVRL